MHKIKNKKPFFIIAIVVGIIFVFWITIMVIDMRKIIASGGSEREALFITFDTTFNENDTVYGLGYSVSYCGVSGYYYEVDFNILYIIQIPIIENNNE